MRTTAPEYRSWALRRTSLPWNIVGMAAAVLMCAGAALAVSSDDKPWIYVLYLAFGIWVGIGCTAGTVTLCRFPALRGADLPLRPVSTRAIRLSTLALIVVASTTGIGGAVWWLTEDWTPWAVVLGAGALLTVGAFFDRYLLLNRARNEALLAAGTARTEAHP